MGDAREDAVLPADLEDGYSTGGAVRLLFQLPVAAGTGTRLARRRRSDQTIAGVEP